MASKDRINFTVGFNTDTSGLQQAMRTLQEIKKMTLIDFTRLKPELIDVNEITRQFNQVKTNAAKLEGALNRSLNKDLGTINVAHFNKELQKLDVPLKDIYRDMASLGPQGANAFRNIATTAMTARGQVEKTETVIDKMGKSLLKTSKWFISSSIVNRVAGSVQESIGYVKSLDRSLNDIRIVTGASADEMDRFAAKANKTAKALGSATTEYTNASLIFYQQGLSDKEVKARADVTTKVSNVTGLSGDQSSEYVTSILNGYQVATEGAEAAMDKLAAVAAMSASSLDELAIGMSKVASSANAMGVTEDQLVATMSTIISVTRQAPESVGTALKTIYARLGDLKLDGEDEFGVSLGDVSGQLHTLGIEILDQQGNMRDMGIVMEEVAAKWDTWTDAQRTAAAVAMAGKRQYNNLTALFENWDLYEDSLNASTNSLGTLQKQQDIYLESTAAHLQKTRTAFEGVYDSLLDADSINLVADLGTGLATGLESVIDALGGGAGVLSLLGAVIPRVFNKQITKELMVMSQEVLEFSNVLGGSSRELAQLNANFEVTKKYAGAGIGEKGLEQITKLQTKLAEYYGIASKEQIKAIDNITDRIAKEYGLLEIKNKEIEQHQIEIYDLEQTINLTEQKLKLLGKVNALQEAGSYSIHEGVDKPVSDLAQDAAKTKKNLSVAQSKEYEQYILAITKAKEAQKLFDAAGEEDLKERKKLLQSLIDKTKELAIAYKAAFGQELPGAKNIEEKSDITKANTNTVNIRGSETAAVIERAGQAQFGGLTDNLAQIGSFLTQTQKASEGMTKFGDASVAGFKGAQAAARKNLGEVLKQFKELKKQGQEVPKDLKDDFTELYESVKRGASVSTQVFIEKLEELTERFEDFKKGKFVTNDDVDKFAENSKKGNTTKEQKKKEKEAKEDETEIIKENIDKLQEKADDIFSDLDFGKLIEASNEGLSAISSITTGIFSLKGAIDTLNNTDISFGEKLLQVTMSLSMGLPMLFTGIASLGKVIKDTAIATGALTAVEATRVVVGAKELSQEQQEAIVTLGLAKSKDELAYHKKEVIKQNLLEAKTSGDVTKQEAAETLLNSDIFTGKNRIETLASNAATKSKFAKKVGEFVAKKSGVGAVTAAAEGGMVAVSGLGTSLATLAASIAPVIAVIAALGLAIWGVVKYLNRFDDKAKESKELASSLKTSYDELKTSYTELTDKLASYENAKNGLKELKKETIEWKNAVYDLNEQVLSLMEKYPELAEKVSRNKETGALELDEETIKEYQNKLNQEVANRQNSYIAQSRVALEDELKAKINKVYPTDSVALDWVTKVVKIGAEDNSIYASQENLIKAVDGIDQYSAESIIQNANELRKISEEYRQQDAAQDVQESQIIDNLLNDTSFRFNQEYLASGNKTEIVQEVQTRVTEQEAQKDNLKDSLKETYDFGELRKLYAQNAGYDFDEDTEKIIKTNEEGEEEEIDISEDEILEFLASTFVTKSILNDFEEINAKVEKENAERLSKLTSGQRIQEGKQLGAADITEDGKSASTIAADSLQQKVQSGYVTKNNIEKDIDFETIKNNAEGLVQIFPNLQSAVNTFLDKSKVGTQEWNFALEQIADKMAILSGTSLDVFTKDDAINLGITSLKDLDAALENGIINLIEYTKMAPAVADAQAELYGYSAEGLDVYAEEMEKVIDAQDDSTKSAKDYEKEARSLALANMQVKKGLDDLASNWDKYEKAMNGTDEIAKAEAIGEIERNLTNVLGLGDGITASDFLSSDFVENNMSLIKDAIDGVDGALDELWLKAGRDYIVNLQANEPQAKAEFNKLLTDLGNLPDVEVGASIDNGPFIQGLNEMLRAGQITRDEANALLSGIGYDPVIEERELHFSASTAASFAATGNYPGQQLGQMLADSLNGELKSSAATTIRIPVINPTKTRRRAAPSGSSASSGGGGGGGSQPSEGSNEEKFDEEIDLYHEIETQINKVTAALEKLQSQQEKMSGKNLQKNLQAQIKENQKLIDLQKAKLTLMQRETAMQRSQLEDRGTTFNEDGTILNYYELLQQRQNEINAAVDSYNARFGEGKTLSEEQQKQAEKEKEKIEDLKDAYSELQELMDAYDENVSSNIPELQQAIQDAYDEAINIKIESLQKSIEIHIDIEEAKRELNDFIAEIAELRGITYEGRRYRGVAGAAVGEALSSSQNIGSYENDYKTQLDAYKRARDAYNRIQRGKKDSIYGDNAAAALEDMQEYAEGTRQALSDMYGEFEDIASAYSDMLSGMEDSYDRQADLIDYLNEGLENQLTLIEKFYGEEAYERQEQVYSAEVQNNLNSINLYKSKIDTLTTYVQTMKEKFGEESEQFQEARNSLEEAQQEMSNLVVETVETIVTRYETAVKRIIKSYVDTLAGGSASVLSEQWETYKQDQERYLDELSKIYGKQDYFRQVREAIDNADTVEAQRQLNELQEREIKNLEEINRLSQDDLTHANLRLQLLLKQIALEEAQANKTKMRLRRDSQGNYNYVYTADEDAIDKAKKEEQDAAKKYYDEMVKDYKNNQENYLNAMETMRSELEELFLNSENYDMETGQLTDIGMKKSEAIMERNMNRLNAILKISKDNYWQLLDASKELGISLDEFSRAEWDSMSLEEQNKRLQKYISYILNNEVQLAMDNIPNLDFDALTEDILDELRETQAQMDSLENTSGTTDLSDTTTVVNVLTEASNELAEANVKLNETWKNNLAALNDIYDKYKQFIEFITGTDFATAMNSIRRITTEVNNAQRNDANAYQNAANQQVTLERGETQIQQTNGRLEQGDVPEVIANTDVYKDKGLTNKKETRKKEFSGIVIDIQGSAVNIKDIGWIDKSRLKQGTFDTGGYTGRWNSDEGKLAFLHSKELVLNKQDTKNILSAVSVMRTIEDIDNQILQHKKSLANLINLTPYINDKEKTQIDQNVHINATFPGVKDASEIETALNNLVNSASQYAWR